MAPRLHGLFSAALALALAAGVTWALRGIIGNTAGIMLFLTAVLVNAVRCGFWIGLASALGAFAAFNFLFVAPRFTFNVAHPQDLITLAVFLLVAGLTGLLAGRLREQRDAAQGRAVVLTVLSQVSSDLTAADTPAAILGSALRHLASVAPGPAMVLTCEDAQIRLIAALPEAFEPQAIDLQAADQALRHGRTEFASAEGWNGSAFTFVPITSGGFAAYVLGHTRLAAHLTDLPYREEAVAVICRQTELALQRQAFAESATQERQRAEAESLRAALLASLSHDLRTPLATILGAVTTLRDPGLTLPAPAQADLLEAIEQEADRLSRYVENLLQMTRLQAGLTVRSAWVDAGDVARAAARRAGQAYPATQIELVLPDLPMIRAEAGLLEQALFNLLENAAKYAPGPIRLEGALREGALWLSVADTGPGPPPGLEGWLQADLLTGAPSATGLGLPICKGIARALGGTLTAQSRPGGGSLFTLHLPLPDETAA
ncbi:protein of unknown function [Gemmobacter aquatilis]|uniref:histidine kinase n=2 Tax=Gemmobacter aquatilis TaxID=933059 RepID=A0A1H8J506_9RHOB|nr:protein of unknown function [Gemmobacter aquatilis]